MEKVLEKFQENLKGLEAEEFKKVGRLIIASTKEESFIDLRGTDLVGNSIINACVQDKKILEFFVEVVDLALSILEKEEEKEASSKAKQIVMIPKAKGLPN